MSEVQIRNAIIESAEITNEDHGLLSAWLFLDYGDCGGQGFGGQPRSLTRKDDPQP